MRCRLAEDAASGKRALVSARREARGDANRVGIVGGGGLTVGVFGQARGGELFEEPGPGRARVELGEDHNVRFGGEDRVGDGSGPAASAVLNV